GLESTALFRLEVGVGNRAHPKLRPLQADIDVSEWRRAQAACVLGKKLQRGADGPDQAQAGQPAVQAQLGWVGIGKGLIEQRVAAQGEVVVLPANAGAEYRSTLPQVNFIVQIDAELSDPAARKIAQRENLSQNDIACATVFQTRLAPVAQRADPGAGVLEAIADTVVQPADGQI